VNQNFVELTLRFVARGQQQQLGRDISDKKPFKNLMSQKILHLLSDNYFYIKIHQISSENFRNCDINWKDPFQSKNGPK
jgi:hypothetical protein